MSGNWAVGRVSMETSPTMTMRIEITMATMGRLMKNFDILSALRYRISELGVDRHTLPHLLDAFRAHAFSGIEPVVDNPHRAHSVGDFHSTNGDLVVLADHCNLIGSLQFGDSALRDKQRIFSQRRDGTDPSKL